jgi:heat shock protein HslJ
MVAPVEAAPRTKRAQTRVVAPPAAQPVAAARTPAIALSGTYALTRVMGRPVRDPDLAASRLTFLPRFDVTGQTACNGFAARLLTGNTTAQILGFDRVVATEMACTPKKTQAEAATLRLLRDTANIARAGNSISLINTNGVAIAQFSAVAPAAPAAPEASAPQRGAPPPTRVELGDYQLSELGGVPVNVRPLPNVVPQPVLLPNTRFLTILPTLYVRANGAVSGLSGCNQYNTSLVPASPETSRFGPVASTRKACLDRSTQRVERELLAAFQGAVRVEVNQARVSLYRGDGSRLARFSSVSERAGSGPSLFGTTWILRSLNGNPIRLSNPPSIVFEGNQVIGSGGCNRFNMIHERRNGRSHFKDGAMTQMACLDQARSQLEQQFMQALYASTTIAITPTQLTLRSDDGGSIMVFEAD